MCFIDDHKVPTPRADVCGFTTGKLVGANDNVLGVKWAEVSLFDRGIVGLGFENAARQEELLLQLLVPLLAKMCRGDDQHTALALGPFLGHDQACLDGFSQAHFVRQNGAFGQWGLERKEGGLDLMRVQVDLCIHQCTSELLKAIGSAALGQLVGEIFGVVICQVHLNFTESKGRNRYFQYLL
jgi:hypothetical protein